MDRKEELKSRHKELLNCIKIVSDLERQLYELKLFNDALLAHNLMSSLTTSSSMIEDELINLK